MGTEREGGGRGSRVVCECRRAWLGPGLVTGRCPVCASLTTEGVPARAVSREPVLLSERVARVHPHPLHSPCLARWPFCCHRRLLAHTQRSSTPHCCPPLAPPRALACSACARLTRCERQKRACHRRRARSGLRKEARSHRGGCRAGSIRDRAWRWLRRRSLDGLDGFTGSRPRERGYRRLLRRLLRPADMPAEDAADGVGEARLAQVVGRLDGLASGRVLDRLRRRGGGLRALFHRRRRRRRRRRWRCLLRAPPAQEAAEGVGQAGLVEVVSRVVRVVGSLCDLDPPR